MKSLLPFALGCTALFALAACGQSPQTPSPAERAARAATAATPSTAEKGVPATPTSPNNQGQGNQGHPKDAAAAGRPNLDRVKALLQGASQGRTRATGLFDGPDGLVGVLTVENASNVKGVIFTNSTGTLVLPMVIGENGENLIEKAMVDQQVYAKPEDVLTQAAAPGAKGILFGKSGPIVTVYMDPNCYYCHKLFQDAQDPVKAGKVRLRFVMVGFLKPDSIPKSAAILAAKDPVAEISKDELQFDEKTESGATAVPATPDPAALEAVNANNRAFGELGPISTPGLLYCSNNKVVFTRGAPPDLATFFANASTEGHPACGK